jgi:hypothetical protein
VLEIKPLTRLFFYIKKNGGLVFQGDLQEFENWLQNQ